jgi:hypothetical protein
MNKNELEYAKVQADAVKFDTKAKLVRHLLSILGVLVAIRFIFNGVNQLIAGQGPDGIMAISKVINAMSLGHLLGYIWGATMSVLWVTERKGKKRAIEKKSKYQKTAEEGDGYRGSSNLTETGDTPR